MWVWVLGLFQKRPIIIVYLVIAVAFAAGWLHYTGVISERDQLEQKVSALELSVETQNDTIDAVEQRSKEIAESLREYELTIASLEATSRDLRNRNARLQQQFEDLDLEREIEQNPNDAGSIASGLYNDFVRLRRCRTNPNSDAACGLGTDTTAEPTTSGTD